MKEEIIAVLILLSTGCSFELHHSPMSALSANEDVPVSYLATSSVEIGDVHVEIGDVH